MSTLGSRLKLLRSEKKLTQEDLAELLNISRSAVSLYEIDKNEPPDNIKKLLSDIFGVSIDYLCGFSDQRTYINVFQIDGDNFSKVPVIDFNTNHTSIINEYTYRLVPFTKTNGDSYFFTTSPENFSLYRIIKGDSLYIKETNFVKNESLALVSLNDEIFIKKVFIEDTNYILFNSSYEPNFITVPKHQTVILGTIEEVSFDIR